MGLYYGADRSGAGTAGSLAAVPDPAQWSEESAGSGEAPVAGAASAAALEEEPVQSKTTEPLETADGTETAGAPRSGAANGEDPSKVAGVPRASLAQGENAAGAAPEPAQADREAGGPALYLSLIHIFTLSPGLHTVIMADIMASVPPQVTSTWALGSTARPVARLCLSARASRRFWAP